MRYPFLFSSAFALHRLGGIYIILKTILVWGLGNAI